LCNWSNERIIFADFPTSSKVQRAVEELQEAGFTEMKIDKISHDGSSVDSSYDNSINNAETSNDLTDFSTDGGSENTLLAADLSASGYRDRDYGIAGGEEFLLTLFTVTDDNRVEDAVKIIEKNGGTV